MQASTLAKKAKKKIGDTVLFFEIRRIEGHTTIRVQHALLATLAKAVRSGQVFNTTKYTTTLRSHEIRKVEMFVTSHVQITIFFLFLLLLNWKKS